MMRFSGDALHVGVVLGVVWVCGASGCVAPQPEPKPEAPSMTQTLRSFEAPGADLTPSNVVEAVNELIARNTVLELLGVESLVLDTLDDVDDAEAEGQQQASGLRTVEQGIELGGEGFVRVSRICDGWGEEPSADPSHGAMRLVVPFTDDRLDPVVWGFFDECQFVSDGEELLLGRGSEGKIGDVRFSAGAGTALGDVGSVPLVFELDLAYTVLNEEGVGETLRAQVEFRVEPSSGGAPEILLPVGDEALTARLVEGGVSIRAANGEWECDLEARQCSAGDDSFSF